MNSRRPYAIKNPKGPRAALFLIAVIFSTVLPAIAAATDALPLAATGDTFLGDWSATGSVSPRDVKPGQAVRIELELSLPSDIIAKLAASKYEPDCLTALVTAERTFDSTGWLRFASAEKMSTLLTPSGLPIEGGVHGAVTDRFGSYWAKTPFDALKRFLIEDAKKDGASLKAKFLIEASSFAADLSPGIYRYRIDFGFSLGKNFRSLCGEQFAYRPFPKEGRPMESYFYSQPFNADGLDTRGAPVKAASIKPSVPWVILSDYNSNGYRGAIALEDKERFALGNRNIIQDEVILPLYRDAAGKSRIAYSLEPVFPVDSIDPRAAIPWNYGKGELSIRLTRPDGSVDDLGSAKFIEKKGFGMTTKNPRFTAWEAPMYGRYRVEVSGWIEDAWGRRYPGGGTYSFWIAKRMTMATATFQGMAYPVGSRYGRDVAFFPPVPAEVSVEASLFALSSKTKVKRIEYSGRASPQGIFGAAQGMKPFALDEPGEYSAHLIATHTDASGHLWVCAMTHAGIVYPQDTPLLAKGKKLSSGGAFVERGDSGQEGHTEADGSKTLIHINYPYRQNDVLLIAAEGEGANKIEPVLTYDLAGESESWNAKLASIGQSNLRMRTSNGYCPHLYPEYVVEREYYYGSAPRPGFMSRFIVAESGTRAPYWPTTGTNFGGQIGAGINGDLPGDIYRLMGGIVLSRAGKAPLYAGYQASAFIIPGGSNANRVIAAGSEDLLGPTGEKARFFLVGLRPGTALEKGTLLTASAQIDPILPVKVKFSITYPDGTKKATEGMSDSLGGFAGPERFTLDQTGLYRYWIEAEWQGHTGVMPGLPRDGGYLFVFDGKAREDPSALSTNLPSWSSFPADKGFTINGSTNCQKIYFTALMPGAVLAQGEVLVKDGKWQYLFDPIAINKAAPIYDLSNPYSGKQDESRLVHLSFFGIKKGPAGETEGFVQRVTVRGREIVAAR